MNFDTHIDLGNILTIATLLFTFWVAHQANVKRIHSIEFKVGLMWKHFAAKFDLPEDLEQEEHLHNR